MSNERKKVSRCRKKLKGVSFSLVSHVTLKKELLLQFNSLGQMKQFGPSKFCRTILVSSCGLKTNHYYSRVVSLHLEAPTAKDTQCETRLLLVFSHLFEALLSKLHCWIFGQIPVRSRRSDSFCHDLSFKRAV